MCACIETKSINIGEGQVGTLYKIEGHTYSDKNVSSKKYP